MRWEKFPETENGPGKRWGHTCNSVRGGRLLYVFGGYGKDNCQTNQVHVFDTATKTWSKPALKGSPPPPRDSHSCTPVGDNLYVFGGTDGMNPLRDLHILDTLSHKWISPAVRGDGPEPREGHSAALVGKRLFIFGGCGKSSNSSEEVYYNDLYILNTETFVWKQVTTTGTPPSVRDSHTCSSWKNKIIVIGGEDGHDYYLSDVHILDAETLVWKELNITGLKLPPRAGHSTVAFGKNLFVFGGFTDAQNLYDDLHVLDVETGVWTKRMTTGFGPSARFSMAGDCLDPCVGGVLVFMGGCNKNLEALDDMYYLHTGFPSVRDERRLEKLSLRKQLKLKCQGQNFNSPIEDQSLMKIDASAYVHQTVPTYAQPSRENLYSNQVQFQGKTTFQAKVTENFPHGYAIETIIDGKPLRGILFANNPQSSQMVDQSNSRKRVDGESGALLNGDHSKLKMSRTLEQDEVDHRHPGDVHRKETATHESKSEADTAPGPKTFTPGVSPLYKAPSNPEPSVAALNLNDEMMSDATNSDPELSRDFSTPARDSINLTVKQDDRTPIAGVGNYPG